MEEDKKCCNTNVQNASLMGPVWFIGWLFTIGFLHLSFWKAVLALLLWPYYLGVAVGA